MISVVIPALNEAKTIADLIRFAQRSHQVSEVIVIDDGSIDGTPELAQAAGATVLRSTMLGKGASMKDGMLAATADVVVYLDGDLSALENHLIERLAAPILSKRADFVKAKFSRSGGRVTKLTAKPLLQVFFPELAWIDQPLGGIVAARKQVLKQLSFELDYGVDVALLIDAWASGATISEIEVGHIEHSSRPLDHLAEMASQVVRAIFDRALRYKRFSSARIAQVAEVDRRRQAELAAVLDKIGEPERIALVDMDGTLLKDRFVVELAKRVEKLKDLLQFLDHPTMDAVARTLAIAKLFAKTPLSVFHETAQSLTLTPGAEDMVVGLRKAGYRVGIVTDSYHFAADIVRRRVFADFTVAHVMKHQDGAATGELVLSPFMLHRRGCTQHRYCKANVLQNLSERTGVPALDFVAIGDGLNDLCMLKMAGTSFAVNTQVEDVRRAAHHRIEGDLAQILPILAGEIYPMNSMVGGFVEGVIATSGGFGLGAESITGSATTRG
jgi:glucosyl-3-phosphoglycerate synthase